MCTNDTDPRTDADASAADDSATGERSGGGRSRRAVLKSAGAAGIAGLVGSSATGVGQGGATAGSAREPWTIVAIPDTQVHAMYRSEPDRRLSYTESMVEWIVDNVDEENIAFVSHMGDMVQEGDDRRQFERIDAALGPLDDVVPWSPCVGNHDYHNTGYNGSTENFRDFFGAHRFEDRDYFGGVGPKGNCFYQFFSAGGYDFMHLSLEYAPEGARDRDNSDLPFGWAKDVLNEHSDVPTVLTTHFYLSTPEHNVAGVGNEIRDYLVNPNPQVFMVLNGHHTTENHHVHENDAGENVYAAVTDYQSYGHGFTGLFRQFRFIPDGGDDAPDRIQVKTYSHHEEERGYRHDVIDDGVDCEWHWDLDFDERFGGSGGGGGDDGSRTVEGGVYKLVNVNSGKVLDVDGVSTDHGATLQQWGWQGGDNQQWQVEHLGDGEYRLVARHSGKVADVENVSTDDGADVHQWGWQGDANQRWYIDDLGGGEYRIRSVHSGKVMDVSGHSTDDGANVHQWRWHGDANQRWRLESVDGCGGDGDDGESGPGTNRLVYGDTNTLHPGEHLESANGDYRLYFQASDGNLVLRETSTGDPTWASHTAGDGGTELTLQSDGNLVMYTDGGDSVWASHTAGSGADELVLEDDGALVLSADGSEVWAVNNYSNGGV